MTEQRYPVMPDIAERLTIIEQRLLALEKGSSKKK